MSLERVTSFVVDASALVEYLLVTDVGRQVASIVEGPEAALHAPALVDVEVCATLRRISTAGQVADDRAAFVLNLLAQLPITRHGHQRLLPRIYQLRGNFTAYDAAYIALSERLSATFITADGSLTRAARDHVTLNVIGVG